MAASTYTDARKFEKEWWPQGKSADPEFVDAAAIAAYNVINSMLGHCYTVPFSTSAPPGIIKTISDLLTRLIVEYIVMKNRLPKLVDLQEKSALNPLNMLIKICESKMSIPGVSRLTTTGAKLVGPANYTRIFDYDSEIWHAVDRDQLDDLLTEREN